MSGREPSPIIPGVQPVGAMAVPGFEVVQWHGLVGPAGLAPEVVTRINTAVNGLLSDNEMQQRLAAEGAEAAPRSPDAFRQLIASELDRFKTLVQRAGVRAD